MVAGASSIAPNQPVRAEVSVGPLVASLRRNTNSKAASERMSAALLPQIAPLRPKAQVAGTPTRSETKVANASAAKTESGDSIARKAIEGPKVALQKI